MNKYVILDLEWTSWKGNYFGRNFAHEKRKFWQKKEILQIGAIKFNRNYKIINKLNLYVKPNYNKTLSDYIINLTGITDKILKAKGVSFYKSYNDLKKFCRNSKIFCNGDDSLILKKNLIYNNLRDKNLKIKNIKRILNKKYGIPKKYLHSPIIHTFFGYKLNRKKMHNAINDCNNVLNVLKVIKFNYI